MTKARFRPFTLNECGDVLDVNEMAKLFHVGTDAITKRCRHGQIPGAFKQGKSWYCSKDKIREVAGLCDVQSAVDISKVTAIRPAQ